MLDKKVLRFLTVVEFGSISLAAREMNITQPALSASMRDLEASVGSRLFDRRPDGISLTYAGRVFFVHAENVFSEMQYAKSELAAITGTVSGNIRVGAGPNWAIGILPEAISRFREQFANVEITVMSDTPGKMFQLVANGELDIFAGALDLIEVQRFPDIIIHKEHETRAVLVARKDNPVFSLPIGHETPIVLDRILILNDLRNRTDEQALNEVGITLKENGISVSSSIAALRIVAKTDAAMTIPAGLFEILKTPNLEIVPVEFPTFSSGLAYRYPVGKLPLMKRFIEVVEAVATEIFDKKSD